MNFAAFVGPAYTSQSRIADCERLVNLYLERNASAGAKAPWTLLPTPGLERFATATEGPIRGSWAQDGDCLQVAGYVVYALASDGTLTNKGTVARDTSPATLSSSGDAGAEVCITSGGLVYIYNLATDLLGAAIAGLVGNQGGYLDGYFLALEQSTSKLRISDLLDGTTWDPTQFTQRSSAADKWQAVLVSGQYIWLFGSETSDVWANAGAFPFPFAPAGSVVQTGIAAPFSAVDINGTPFWLSKTARGLGPVVRGNGLGVPTPVSTAAVDNAIRGYATVSDAQGFGFDLNGHRFYVIVFPTAQAGWIFDESTDQWFEYLYWNPTLGRYEAPRAGTHCYAFGQHLVGDRSTGAIYTLDPDVFDDDGDAIRRMRVCPLPTLTSDGNLIVLDELRLFMQTGIGLDEGDEANPPVLGSDPQVAFRFSKDGGATFGNERTTTAGKIGEYQTRVIWNRGGVYRDGLGVVEIVVTDPVFWSFSGASFLPRVGGH